VIGEVLPDTKPVFMQKSIEMEADIFFVDTENSPLFVQYEEDSMIFNYRQHAYASGLTGLYQQNNLATVFLAIKVLNDRTKFKVSEIALQDGIKNVCQLTGLRGRWELISNEPRIIVDTGHNVQGIQAIANQLKYQKYKTLRIIIGMVNDKDISGVLKLLPVNAMYYFTRSQVKRALSETELKKKALIFGLNGKSYNSINDAIEKAVLDAENEDLILITGSNFVVGEAIAYCTGKE
jgi:dihydrofolate synthase/folylpolyglutamate synthase